MTDAYAPLLPTVAPDARLDRDTDSPLAYLQRAKSIQPTSEQRIRSTPKPITEDMLPDKVVPDRIMEDPQAFAVWKRNVLRGGCAKTNLRLTRETVRPQQYSVPHTFGGKEMAEADAADRKRLLEADDEGYPFYDPEYLVTKMYSCKRGLLVQTPDRGEQCIYWAGQEMPGGAGDLEETEKNRTVSFFLLSSFLLTCSFFSMECLEPTRRFLACYLSRCHPSTSTWFAQKCATTPRRYRATLARAPNPRPFLAFILPNRWIARGRATSTSP